MSSYEYSEEFLRFWSAWPDNGSKGFEDYTRKKDKIKCGKLWEQRKFTKLIDLIIRNVEQRKKFDKGWLSNRGKFLEGPHVYLNNERWDDGQFADIRDDSKPARPTAAAQQEEYTGPHYSRWACYANKLLVRMQMRDLGKARFMLNDRNRVRVLKAKNDLIAQVERDHASGETWDDEDFKDVINRTLTSAFAPREPSPTNLLEDLHA